ncbi:phage integrase N-terminal SAM-like domain-containing protein [Noviherbaspirillum saxi]|uniref:phage integrase N-terminal SAM-like domain-containing protein n=1 Tax=Noviherbaspirillum saxi TaxID=2320863 RepID=UPI003B75CAD0
MENASLNTASGQPPKLLDQLRRCLRDKHYSLRTERVYVYWARWYIRFHQLRHPNDMGDPEIHAFCRTCPTKETFRYQRIIKCCVLCFFCTNMCCKWNCLGSITCQSHRSHHGSPPY